MIGSVCADGAVSTLRREARRAPIGPGLWPVPRRQARWAVMAFYLWAVLDLNQ
jgi:hypothetical protein